MARTQIVLLLVLGLLAGAVLGVVSHRLGGDKPSSQVVVAPSPAVAPSPIKVAIAPPISASQASPAAAASLDPDAKTPNDGGPPDEDEAPARDTLRRLSRTSDRLCSYLHKHRLPHVNAVVRGYSDGKPVTVTLTGWALTPKGQRDAEQRSRDYLANSDLDVDNQVVIGDTSSTTSGESGTYSTAPTTGSSGNGYQSAGNDPCLCLHDETHCKNQCGLQMVPGSGLDWRSWVGGSSGQGAQVASCVDNCTQTREHCVSGCQQNAGP